MASSVAFAEHDLERRLREVEQRVYELDRRVQQLEYGGGGGGHPCHPSDPYCQPGGGDPGYPGQRISCTLTTNYDNYHGHGQSRGEAVHEAKSKCLQRETSYACNAGSIVCRR